MARRKALNDTALGTVNWLANWGKRIKAEMKKQNIDRHPKRELLEGRRMPWPVYGPDDNKELITFERGVIRQLLDEMSERIEKLQRFEKPIAKAHDADDR